MTRVARIPDGGRGSTLRLRRPFGRTVGLAILMLAVFVCLAELSTRVALWRGLWPMAVAISGNSEFDMKLLFLDALVEQHGKLDCVLLGASPVKRGIDPEIVEAAYRVRTGRTVRCFNFGLAGLNPPAAEGVARVLAKRYDFGLLILGMMPTVEAQGEAQERRLMGNPWIRHQLGSWNLDGWLVSYSSAYQAYVSALDPFNYRSILEGRQGVEVLTRFGYLPTVITSERIAAFPDPVTEQGLFDLFSHSSSSLRHRQAFERILRMQSGVQVVVLEMPFHRTFSLFFKEGQSGFERLVAESRTLVERLGVRSWSMPGPPIPDTGWKDRVHLNDSGAGIFSRWLGERIGDAVSEGTLTVPQRDGPIR